MALVHSNAFQLYVWYAILFQSLLFSGYRFRTINEIVSLRWNLRDSDVHTKLSQGIDVNSLYQIVESCSIFHHNNGRVTLISAHY